MQRVVYLGVTASLFVACKAGGGMPSSHQNDGAVEVSTDATGSGSQQSTLRGGAIAFVSDRDGNPEIYSVNVDGSNLERLTNDAGRDDLPSWSPDGSRIAFISDRTGHTELYVMNADGTNVVRRTFANVDCDSPAWSPDGSKIVYATLNNGSENLWAVGPDSGSPAQLFAYPGWDNQAAWSPDGSKIAFVSDYNAYDFVDDIFVINADGTGAKDLTGGKFDNVDYFQPSWSPDGTKLSIAITKRTGTDSYETNIGVMNATGGGMTPLVPADTWTRSSWSPDGTKIAFTSVSGGTKSVSWIAADGSSSGTIIANGWGPAWHK